MADVALAAAALPENARSIWQIAKATWTRIRVWRDAPNSLRDLKDLHLELYEGSLATLIQLAEISKAISYDRTFNERVTTFKERLRAELDMIHIIISKCYNDKREVDRIYFAGYGKQRLEESLTKLREWLQDFRAFISDRDVINRFMSGKTLLSRPRLQMTSNFDGDYSRQLPGVLHIYLGKAELREDDGTFYHSQVILERLDDEKIPATDKEYTLACLAGQLSRDQGYDPGLLRCLGWRREPRHELIFQFPLGAALPKTLREIMDTRESSTSERLLIAKQIAKATLAAARRDIVHKNLHPDTILLFEPQIERPANDPYRVRDLQAYLTDWKTARTKQMASAYAGTNDWKWNIYRHPERQGLGLEHRYHTGHDIYSLGVVLLEIGLWKPLVVHKGDTEYTVSELYRQAASKLGIRESDDSNALRELVKPANCPQIFQSMARDHLPINMGMGEKYTRLIIDCINSVSNGFLGIKDFGKPWSELESIFKSNISDVLDNIQL